MEADEIAQLCRADRRNRANTAHRTKTTETISTRERQSGQIDLSRCPGLVQATDMLKPVTSLG